jgi:Protein of unknown function (DUF3293)
MSDVTDVLPARLLAAYCVTCYRVRAPKGELLLHVDEHDAGLARLLRDTGVDTAALLTAWNPGSRMQPPEVNRAMQAALERELHEAGIVCLHGMNEGPIDSSTAVSWSEESLLAMGISLEGAHGLALRYGQLAFLWIDAEATPRLFLTVPSSHM